MRAQPIFALFALACTPEPGAGGTDSGAPETDLEAAFCGLLQDGPEEEATAAASPGDGPQLAIEDAVVELDLLPDGDDFSGWAVYSADEAGSFAFGLGQDVEITVLDAAGDPLAPEATVGGAACAELAVRYTFPLEVADYAVRFESDEDEVDFVSEESDDDLAR